MEREYIFVLMATQLNSPSGVIVTHQITDGQALDVGCLSVVGASQVSDGFKGVLAYK